MPKTNSPYSAVNDAFFKRSKHPPARIIVPTGHVIFRLLCHSSRVGGVIGKSGTIIKQLQHDTAAKIRVVESPHGGADDRVIIVVASSSVNRRITLDKEESEVSSAQEAVVRVFERIVDVAAEMGDGVSVSGGGVVSCRLLAENGQAGAVIGKGGKVVEKIKEDTGCKIRVLSLDKSPSSDEIVEIEGDMLAVKKALVAVSLCLQDCPLVDRVKTAGSRPGGVIPQEPLQDLLVDLPLQRISVLPSLPADSFTYASGGRPVLRESERAPTLELRTQQHKVVFMLLCSSDRVGSVIGKGGTIVRALQIETGASIIIGAPVAECDERLITVTAIENPESRYSPAQHAVLLVFNRYIETGAGKGLDLGSRKGSPASARLVVPSNQVGCLLGKGGTVVSEMRKTTGAYIRIIGNDQTHKCVSNNDDIVQITGEFVNVRYALSTVTSRLRDNLFSSRIPNDAGTRSSASVITESSSFGRAKDPSSLGMHTSVVSHNLNRQSITYSMDQLGLSHHKDCPPSPRLWVSQTVAEMNSRSAVDVGKGQTSIKGGLELGSGGRSAIVRNTTVEIIVPENVIGSVYGENGSNLARLRQISGAKVVVHEPHPGTQDRMVVISGTNDETQAAQSLLQAFILTGSS